MTGLCESSFILPDWPAPSNVAALATTRIGGVSQPPFDELNLALHVADDAERVLRNRNDLADWIQVAPEQIKWLEQVHGTYCVDASTLESVAQADASFTHCPEVVCVIMTADCLPVLMCNKHGTHVAAAHAGWRGLATGVLAETLKHFPNPSDVLIWLGPCIGPAYFEVGEDVRAQFALQSDRHLSAFEATGKPGKYLANLPQLARVHLHELGVAEAHIYGGDFCTYGQRSQFYSYRRDGANTGRMASLIYLKP